MNKISIVVVTYNNADVINDCIAALLSAIDKLVFTAQLLIIDNKSDDATIAALQAYVHDDRIKVIENKTNRGFGAGHNIGLSQADSCYHIICNPDIVINDTAIGILADYMGQHPDIGILCPKLLNADGSLQANNHREPNILDLALRRLAPIWLKKRLKKRMDAYIMLDVGYEHSYEVPFVSGAFMFCRTDVLKKVGGFDERYFLYFEDADLSRKVRQQGYRTVYCPDASVVHQWGRAAHKSLPMAFVLVESAVKYFNKWGYRLY
ncbi:MAG: glycosyltransferase family 2 protein [Methylovulum sp.]|nr:glycosyltransferase family 2 protein [Methylovulum sp.]